MTRETERDRHTEAQTDGERLVGGGGERERERERRGEREREREDVQLHITMLMEVKNKPFSRSVRSHSLTKESD